MNEERTFWDLLFAGLAAFGASMPAVMAQWGMDEFRRQEPELLAREVQDFAVRAHLAGAAAQSVCRIPFYQDLNQAPRGPRRT